MADLGKVALALSDPIRLRILDLLMVGRDRACCSPDHPENPRAICACDLRPNLDDMAPSKLGYHMSALREADLVAEEKRGRWVYFSLKVETLRQYVQAISQRYIDPPTCCAPPLVTLTELEEEPDR